MDYLSDPGYLSHKGFLTTDTAAPYFSQFRLPGFLWTPARKPGMHLPHGPTMPYFTTVPTLHMKFCLKRNFCPSVRRKVWQVWALLRQKNSYNKVFLAKIPAKE